MFLPACKKDYNQNITDRESADKVTAVAYQYNTATKKFSPQDSITAQIASPAGVNQVYVYLVRSNSTDSVVTVFFPPDGSENDVAMGVSPAVFSKIDMSAATGLKLMIKHRDNSYHQDSIKITPFTPPLPELQNFPASLLPGNDGQIHVTGKALSQNGIQTIYIYDDATGSFTKVDSITNLKNATSYDVDYNYTYRDKAANLKVQVVDNYDLAAEAVITIPVLPYTVYKDVTMNAQGFATNNAFVAATGTLLGSCELPSGEALSDADMDLLLYGSKDNVLSLYSPGNAKNIAKNYKCNGTEWAIADPLLLKAVKVKILVPGSSDAVDAIYARFNANNIPDLAEDDFFNGISVPGGNTAKISTNTGELNPDGAYLLWVRIPKEDGTFRNCLLRAKSFVLSAGSSTVTFDIYVQK
ncbi:hypothetical protein A8C56_19490 [Niabella ginsenosidivorans]|uniref:Uncharacterized protein n=2 Tax=Niabella ginsenosidivorans TaxID=1176587 RepID=A0A1A9I747_9BACT|nr:hypothetical protein A8C56_19490 [Niabella ginsenosidivorans]